MLELFVKLSTNMLSNSLTVRRIYGSVCLFLIDAPTASVLIARLH